MTSIVLALVLLALPLPGAKGNVYHGLTLLQLMIVAFVGLGIGWLSLDRMATVGIPPPAIVLLAAVIAISGWSVANLGILGRLDPGPAVGSTLAIGFALGGLIRGMTDDRRSVAALVALAAATSWLAFDLPELPVRPMRDFHLYLGAGATALGGASPYLSAPITSVTTLDKLPFVYPPLTIPLFELLARFPQPLADLVWEAGSIGAVVAGLYLVGVRGRWLIVLLGWPPLAQGIAVGNVASFAFVLYILGFRIGAALVLSGVFKVQSMIPSLWLVRERKWRELVIGLGIVAALAALSVPIVGLQTWRDWPTGLRAFAASLANIPGLQGLTLTRWQGPVVALVITVALVCFALRGRGRNALARFGLASVVGSPTLYLHGLAPLLAGALVLGPELLWFFLGLGPSGIEFGIDSAWVAMVVVGVTLLVARDDLRLPGDLTPSRADLHPVARSGQVWPRRSIEVPPEPPAESSYQVPPGPA